MSCGLCAANRLDHRFLTFIAWIIMDHTLGKMSPSFFVSVCFVSCLTGKVECKVADDL